MEKSRGLVQNFTLQHQARPICAKMSTKSHIMVSGDNKNIVSLWRLDKENPITTLGGAQGINSLIGNEITSVCFAPSQYEIFSGSNAGEFCMWDIRTKKLNFAIKEHNSFISCIQPANLPDLPNFVLTGSDDAGVRGWDIREQKCVASYNRHTGRISCIEFSPDGQNFLTGSDDSTVMLWDIRMQKCIKEFGKHQKGITSAIFNPYEIAMLSTSADGKLNYWDLENYELVYSTNVSDRPIQKATFDSDGRYIFTAADQNLKVWYVDSQSLLLVDQIEIGWNGVQDLELQVNSKTGDEAVVGVGIFSSYFGLWGCPMQTLNKNLEHSLVQFKKIRPGAIEEEDVPPQDMMIAQVRRSRTKEEADFFQKEAQGGKNPDTNNRMEIEDENKGEERGHSRGQEYNNPAMEVEDGRMELEENLPLNDLLESTSSIRNVENNPLLTNVSAYFHAGVEDIKKKQYELLSEISQESSIFKIKMTERAKNLKNIAGKWRSSFAFETIPAIEKLEKNDAPMIMSLINTSVVAYKLDKVHLDVICALLRKALILLETRLNEFDLYIKIGLGFINSVIETFHKDLVPKVGQTPGKGREVPKKFIKLVEVLESIYSNEPLKDLSVSDKASMGKSAKKILSDLDVILGKSKASNFNKPKKKF